MKAIKLPSKLKHITHVCQLTMPLLRAFGECKSAIIAVQRLTFPLLIPPTILERRKMPKVLEAAHSVYDVIKPICRSKKALFIKQNNVDIIST